MLETENKKAPPKYLGKGTCKYCKQTIFWFQGETRKYPTNTKDSTDFHSKTCQSKKEPTTAQEIMEKKRIAAFAEWIELKGRIRDLEKILMKCPYKYSICLQAQCAIWNNELQECSQKGS